MKTEALEVVKERKMEVATVAKLDIGELLRYAVDKGVSSETMKDLMAIRRELNAEQAKEAFDSALAAFQAECPPVTKTIGVPDGNGKIAYKYAPFESIIAIVRPFLQKHNFSYVLDTDVQSQPGWVIAKCHITHAAGHFTFSSLKLPLGTKTKLMSDTQVYAAALTFVCRRVFCNAFGIIVAGEDHDGQTQKAKPAGPSTLAAEPSVKDLAAELWNLLKSIRGEAKNWDKINEWLWRFEVLDAAANESAPELSPKRFREVINAAKLKLP